MSSSHDHEAFYRNTVFFRWRRGDLYPDISDFKTTKCGENFEYEMKRLAQHIHEKTYNGEYLYYTVHLVFVGQKDTNKVRRSLNREGGGEWNESVTTMEITDKCNVDFKFLKRAFDTTIKQAEEIHHAKLAAELKSKSSPFRPIVDFVRGLF